MPGKESPPYPSHHPSGRLQLLVYLRERMRADSGEQEGCLEQVQKLLALAPGEIWGEIIPLTSPFLITSSMALLSCSPDPGTHTAPQSLTL